MMKYSENSIPNIGQKRCRKNNSDSVFFVILIERKKTGIFD